MTNREFHFEFKVRSDRIASNDRRDFTPAEIDLFYRNATDLLMVNYSRGSGLEPRSFEENQYAIDNLSTLHVKSPENDSALPVGTAHGNVYEFRLDSLTHDYFMVTRLSLQVSDCTDELDVFIKRNLDLNATLRNPLEGPNLTWRRAIATFGKTGTSGTTGQSSIFIYTNGLFTPTGLLVDYIKKPTYINYGGYVGIDGLTTTQTNTDLPEHLHSRLVDMAVMIAKGVTEEQQGLANAQLKTTLNT